MPHSVAEHELRLQVFDETGREIISYQPAAKIKGRPQDLLPSQLHQTASQATTNCILPVSTWRSIVTQYAAQPCIGEKHCARDPGDARCNNAMGFWHLKRGEFTSARQSFQNAIERLTYRNANPNDGEAFYNLGLCLRFLGEDDQAYDAFYKACWNQAWMAAGYHALARD